MLAEVKQELADISNTTEIIELEAELMTFGQTKGRVGSIKLIHENINVDAKFLRL